MRFATIGSNFILDQVLADAKFCEEFELVAVYSRSMDKAQALAKQHGARFAFDSLEALAACSEVDAVYVSSPNALHKAQSIQMLNAGKHVLCEKPIGSNADEAREMFEAASKNNRLLLEAMRLTFSPSLQVLRDALAEIGPIRHATLSYCKYSSRYTQYLNGEILNTFNPEFSNGSMMDLGVYCVHLLLQLFGMPNKIQSSATLLPTGVDGAGAILASYDGMTAELLFSKMSQSYTRSEIQGERGSITIGECSTLTDVRLHKADSSDYRQLSPIVQENDIKHEINYFIDAVKRGQYQQNQSECSVNAMKIMDEARRQCGIIYPADKK